MTTEEAKESTDVVYGTFLMNSVPAYVLFNCGANLSFVSQTFASKLAVSVTILNDALVIIVANGGQTLVRE